MTSNKDIKEWLNAVERTRKAKDEEEKFFEKARSATLPKNLRPAKSSDIVEGAIIWYPEWVDVREYSCEDDEDDEGVPVALWTEVCEVLCPDDDFKAFHALDGCRHGLDGAFVEVLK